MARKSAVLSLFLKVDGGGAEVTLSGRLCQTRAARKRVKVNWNSQVLRSRTPTKLAWCQRVDQSASWLSAIWLIRELTWYH